MQDKRSTDLGTVRASRGARVWGTWSVLPDVAESEVALAIVQGAADGPTLWVQGCIHGDESDGALTVHGLVAALDPTRLRGTVIAIPVVNAAARAPSTMAAR